MRSKWTRSRPMKMNFGALKPAELEGGTGLVVAGLGVLGAYLTYKAVTKKAKSGDDAAAMAAQQAAAAAQQAAQAAQGAGVPDSSGTPSGCPAYGTTLPDGNVADGNCGEFPAGSAAAQQAASSGGGGSGAGSTTGTATTATPGCPAAGTLLADGNTADGNCGEIAPNGTPVTPTTTATTSAPVDPCAVYKANGNIIGYMACRASQPLTQITGQNYAPPAGQGDSGYAANLLGKKGPTGSGRTIPIQTGLPGFPGIAPTGSKVSQGVAPKSLPTLIVATAGQQKPFTGPNSSGASLAFRPKAQKSAAQAAGIRRGPSMHGISRNYGKNGVEEVG
jgi:type II secretory pathway pseudopilin PulG